MRHLVWLVCLSLLGCQSIGPGEIVALHGASSGLARLLPKSFRPANLPTDPLLAQASQALDANDHERACQWLRMYADQHPESKDARTFLAEVLLKLGKANEARLEYEKAIARLQKDRSPDLAGLLHCHGRLLDLADAEADDYHVHLHRGIGLYLLAQQRPTEADDDIPSEAVLCKAIMELTIAHGLNPSEARPTWYLHLAWRQLGQSAAAVRRLHETHEASAFSYLTPQERADLELRR